MSVPIGEIEEQAFDLHAHAILEQALQPSRAEGGHKSKGLEYDTIVFMGLDDQAWWAHKPGDKEGLAAFFVALSRAKQRAIFAFCQQRGQRSKVAELYALLGQAGVPEIAI